MKKNKKLRFPKVKKEKILNPDGSEFVSSKPTELRAKIIAPVTLRSKMQQMWKEFREKEEENNSEETLADSQDFDVNNDEFIQSPYEVEGDLLEKYDQDLQSHLEANPPQADKSEPEANVEKKQTGVENEESDS